MSVLHWMWAWSSHETSMAGPSEKKTSRVRSRRPKMRCFPTAEPLVWNTRQQISGLSSRGKRGGSACGDARETYIVVHAGGPLPAAGGAARAPGPGDVLAVIVDMGAVVDIVVGRHEAHFVHPVLRFVRPVGVGRIQRVASQARAHVEEDAVGDAVLVVVSIIGGGDLPPHATAARVVVALGGGLGVEDALGQGQPLRLVLGRVREGGLGCEHGRHAPEALIIVTEGQRPVVWLVAVLRLEEHGLRYHVVVARVVGVVPVVNQGPPEGAALPPVVVAIRRRAGQDTRHVAREVAAVVRLHG